MLTSHPALRSIACEPWPGFLVRTSEGYYGILIEVGENDQWVVFLANGLRAILSRKEFQVLPLSDHAESPASFHEILQG